MFQMIRNAPFLQRIHTFFIEHLRTTVSEKKQTKIKKLVITITTPLDIAHGKII